MAATAQMKGEDQKRLTIVVMGALSVGKTALITQFMDGRSEIDYKGTFEEVRTRDYQDGQTNLSLEIVEIREGDSVPTVRKEAIARGDVFILVYSVDDAESFEYIYKLRDLVLEEKGMESNVPILVVANKLDLPGERKTPIWQITDAVVTIDWEHKYAELSANDASHVHGAFRRVIRLAIAVYKDRFVTQRRMTTPPTLLARLRGRISLRKQKSMF